MTESQYRSRRGCREKHCGHVAKSRGTETDPQQRAESQRSARARRPSTGKSVDLATAKMALTCKVQYLDDTDPFASTNFPEPTRPPTYTFHLNIPLCQQVDGLHRLLCAPHAIDDVSLQLSHNGCYLDLENTLEEQADLLEGFLDSRKNTIILRTSLSVRVHNCIAKLLAASGRELRRALFSLKQIFQDDKDLVHEFVNSDGLNALITVGQDADQNYQNYILRAIGQIMLYVDGMNGVINHNETIQWLYSLTASKFRLVAKTALKLLLVFIEYTEDNSRLLVEAVQCVDDAQGIKRWSEIVGILSEKDSLGDEEILIYAMTLVNKASDILYATPDQDTFYDITDDLEELDMENTVKMHQDRRGTNIDLLEQLNIYETALRIEDGDEELPAYGSSPSIRPRKRTAALESTQGDRRRSRRHHSISKIDLAINNLTGEDFRNKRSRGRQETNSLHKVVSAPDMTTRYGEPPSSPVRSSGSASPSSSTHELDELEEKERSRQARRERRAARRAALGFTDNKAEKGPTNNRTESSTSLQKPRENGLPYNRSSKYDSQSGGSQRTTPAVSPYQSPSSSARSSPRGSPTASPSISRRRAKFQQQAEAAEGIEAVRQKTLAGTFEERRKAREELRRLELAAKEQKERGELDETGPPPPQDRPGLTVAAVAKRRSGEVSTDENENVTQRTSDRLSPSPLRTPSHSDTEVAGTEGVVRRRKPKLDEIGRSTSVQEKGIKSPPNERKESIEKRSSICEVLPGGSSNKKMMLSMLYGQQKSSEEIHEKKPDSPSAVGESVRDRRGRLFSSGDSESSGESSINAELSAIENSVQDVLKKLDVVEEDEKEVSSAVEDDLSGVIDRAKKSLMHQDVEDDETKRLEEEERQEEEQRRQQEEEERQRIAAEEAARLQELEWERMITLKRSLIIKDFDFTDLVDEDDVDALDAVDAHDEQDARPPNPFFGGIPPPPPGGGMFPPPPPPPPGGGVPGPPKPPPPGNLSTLNKKKMVRLFWQEVKNSPLINGVNKTIWGSIDQVDIDTKKLEHLFENKTSTKIKQKLEEEKDKRKEIVVLDVKRSQQINIALTKLPPIRTLKQAIISMDSTVIDREGVDKLLQMQPLPEEKMKIQEAQLANPDVPLGTAEQFLLTMASLNELAPRLHLWAFKLDYEMLEKEVAEPLMDLKEALEELNKNNTFKHILATLLAIGNFLNGKKVKGFQLDYLSKVPEVKDTVHKQSLLYHLCCMVMEKFPDTTDLYSELGALHRSSRVDFEVVAENLKNLKENCKRSWEHLSVVAKHDSTKQLKSKMTELLTDAQERITILKVVHRRVMNRFRKMLLYLGVSASITKKTKVNEFCKIISEFSLEYRTTRERVREQKKKREKLRERNLTRGKLITESFGSHGRSPSEENVEEEFRKALFANGEDFENSKEKLKSSTLPNQRNRIRSCRQSTDEFADDNTDEVMDMLVKSATVPDNRTRMRKRTRMPNSNRKSARRTLKEGITPEDLEKLTKQVQILEKKK
ncbi:predicted protein [Nematostella vectensis]|uniref:FH1/FH2 domain-containing protein 3 n=1 Tax=Nematostella vectensis TaxID=45351 RepID=A7SHT8_NEMVE|nr:predicted protein [Nematostella vectensis]|eukprot:XP_001628772.1 predicted protein [Nematostella vectensis]